MNYFPIWTLGPKWNAHYDFTMLVGHVTTYSSIALFGDGSELFIASTLQLEQLACHGELAARSDTAVSVMLQAFLMTSSFMITNPQVEWRSCKIGWALDWGLYLWGVICTMMRRETGSTNTAIIMFIVYLKLYMCIVETFRVHSRIKVTREAYVEAQTMKLMVEQQMQAEDKIASLEESLKAAQEVVLRVMSEGGEILKHFAVDYSDLYFSGKEIGQGSASHFLTQPSA